MNKYARNLFDLANSTRTCFFLFVFLFSFLPHNLLREEHFFFLWSVHLSYFPIESLDSANFSLGYFSLCFFFTISTKFTVFFALSVVMYLLSRNDPTQCLSQPNHNFKRFSDEEKQRFRIHLIIMMRHFSRCFFMKEREMLLFFVVCFYFCEKKNVSYFFATKEAKQIECREIKKILTPSFSAICLNSVAFS